MATYNEARGQVVGIGFHASALFLNSAITADDAGKLGTITANGEWGLGASGAVPYGVLSIFENDLVGAVQDAGFAEIDIADETEPTDEVTVNDWVECDGTGKGKKAAACTGIKAIAVDSSNHKAMILIGSPATR